MAYKPDPKTLADWLDKFNPEARIEFNGKKYSFSRTKLKSIYSSGNYWHSKTDPSSWLVNAMVNLTRRSWKELPREQITDLVGQALNITSEKVEASLNWTANYMAWHDGGTPEENHPFGG